MFVGKGDTHPGQALGLKTDLVQPLIPLGQAPSWGFYPTAGLWKLALDCVPLGLRYKPLHYAFDDKEGAC